MPPAIEAAPAMHGAPHFWKDGEDVLVDKTTIYYALKYAVPGGRSIGCS